MKAKRRKLNEEEDRISDLPDPFLHHILSFSPSTKQTIQTGILSKSWRDQWTRVPVLVFDIRNSSDLCEEDFARFIDSTLHQHDCFTIKKLHLAYNFHRDTIFSSKIRFAMKKQAQELILNCSGSRDSYRAYLLPKFLFDNVSLVKLEMANCYFMDDSIINWGSLKAVKIKGCIYEKSVRNVISGCPSLELLELNSCGFYGKVIASKSLKTLILVDINTKYVSFEISCPKLEELSVRSFNGYDSHLLDEVIENVVSGCPLLRSLVLTNCYFEKLVTSKSLEKLILRNLDDSCAFTVSCPNLKELNCCGYYCGRFKFVIITSLSCATLDFEIYRGGFGKDMAVCILENREDVKDLTIGNWFINILSDVETRGLLFPWLNNKILTLSGPDFEHHHGIICALRSSPNLERLVIKLDVHEGRLISNASGENFWNSNGIVPICLEFHLKTVEIIGFSKRDAQKKLVLKFIKFLFKNAGVLEKLVLVITEDGGTRFAHKVFKKVSSFQRYSQHAVFELYAMMSK